MLMLSEYGKVLTLLTSFFVLAVALYIVIGLSLPGRLRVSFLNVGQGDAILIQTPGGKDMLIDGGPSHHVLSELSKRMKFFDREIDVVIATHGDADHITGLIPALSLYDVRTIVRSPVPARTALFDDFDSHVAKEGAKVVVGKRGDVIDFGDGVIAHVLYPKTSISPKTDTNDASVSVVLTYGDHSFLLTGDLTSKYEPHLLSGKLPRHVTVFKAGHHGSKTSSGAHLLSYIKPEYAVISAGENNRYGHPHEEVLARLANYSQETLSTVDRGTITFISDGRVLKLETER